MKKLIALSLLPILLTGCVGYKINPALTKEDEATVFLLSNKGNGDIKLFSVNGIEIPENKSLNRVYEVPKGEATFDLICKAKRNTGYGHYIEATNRRTLRFDAKAEENYNFVPLLKTNEQQYQKETSFVQCNTRTGECSRVLTTAIDYNARCEVWIYSYDHGKKINTKVDYIIN
ncbi:hypothetical protein [Psychromonas aquatilis]|uniref:Lipoprotein n=1 Tax=Psychromonas aquatilis TaxID=2005072 RepID=A0ABU9GTU2_9GAMM